MMIDSRTCVVITGAANGIGRSIALEAARRGARLALLDIDRPGLDALAALPGASTHLCDVADCDAVRVAARDAVATHGRVHILVNNAGRSVTGPVEHLTREMFENAMGVNFWGVLHACQAFLPHLRATARDGQGAAICTVLSEFALCSCPTKAAYSAAKHAARALTEALAAELYDSGISVTAAYPGATATGILERGYAVDDQKRRREAAFLAQAMSPDAVAQRIVDGIRRRRTRVVIGRDARVADIAVRLSPALFQDVVRRFWRRVPFL